MTLRDCLAAHSDITLDDVNATPRERGETPTIERLLAVRAMLRYKEADLMLLEREGKGTK